MKIALDYDDTYTLDPTAWRLVAHMLREHGHDVRIVTVRDERYDRTEPLTLIETMLPVIYTRGVAKRWFCTHFTGGFVPDVWIDDRPESILENSSATPEWLVDWRTNRVG